MPMTHAEMQEVGIMTPEDFRGTWWLHYEAPDRALVYLVTGMIPPNPRDDKPHWTAHLNTLTFRQMTEEVGYGWLTHASVEAVLAQDPPPPELPWIISAGPPTYALEARIRTLENQVNILVGAWTTHGRIMQAGPPPENPDPAPTVWERLDEDDPV